MVMITAGVYGLVTIGQDLCFGQSRFDELCLMYESYLAAIQRVGFTEE